MIWLDSMCMYTCESCQWTRLDNDIATDEKDLLLCMSQLQRVWCHFSTESAVVFHALQLLKQGTLAFTGCLTRSVLPVKVSFPESYQSILY